MQLINWAERFNRNIEEICLQETHSSTMQEAIIETAVHKAFEDLADIFSNNIFIEERRKAFEIIEPCCLKMKKIIKDKNNQQFVSDKIEKIGNSITQILNIVNSNCVPEDVLYHEAYCEKALKKCLKKIPETTVLNRQGLVFDYIEHIFEINNFKNNNVNDILFLFRKSSSVASNKNEQIFVISYSYYNKSVNQTELTNIRVSFDTEKKTFFFRDQARDKYFKECESFTKFLRVHFIDFLKKEHGISVPKLVPITEMTENERTNFISRYKEKDEDKITC